jgi:hypothetical protein
LTLSNDESLESQFVNLVFDAQTHTDLWSKEERWKEYIDCVNEYNGRAKKVLNRPRNIVWYWNYGNYEQISSGDETGGKWIFNI